MQIRPLAWELLYAAGVVALKGKKKKEINIRWITGLNVKHTTVILLGK